MPRPWLLLLCLVGVAVEGGLVVEEPAELAREVAVYVHNVHMGPRELPAPVLHTPVSVYDGDASPDVAALNCSVFHSTLVLVTSVEVSWGAREDLGTALALERCGAVAVVRRQPKSVGPSSFLGITYYYNDFDCCRNEGQELGVGLLVGWVDDLEPIAAAVQAGQDVVVSIHQADQNPWVHDVFHHGGFIAVARGVLPLMNAVLLLFGCRALATHLPCCSQGRKSRQRSVLDSMRWHVVAALAMLVIGAGVRVAYCAVCPFFSNSNFPNVVTHIAINVSMSLQLPAVVVASVVFHNIISIHTTVFEPSKGWTVVGVLVCAVLLGLELFSGYKRGTNENFVLVFLLSTILVPLIVLVASVIFLFRGIPFLRRMQAMRKLRQSLPSQSKGKSKDPLRHIRVRFTTSIVNASFGMVLQLVVLTVGASNRSLFISTNGFPTLWILYYLGLTIAAFNFVAAFAPGVRVPLPIPKALRQPLARGVKRIAPLVLLAGVDNDAGESQTRLQSQSQSLESVV